MVQEEEKMQSKPSGELKMLFGTHSDSVWNSDTTVGIWLCIALLRILSLLVIFAVVFRDSILRRHGFCQWSVSLWVSLGRPDQQLTGARAFGGAIEGR
jgi:hypothetical protein